MLKGAESERPGDRTTEVAAAIAEEGLRYVSDAAPGYRRKRAGTSFTYFDKDGKRITDAAVVRRIKSIGLLVKDAAVLERDEGPYGREGYVRQGLAQLFSEGGNHAVIGSWVVGDEPAGICIRESDTAITTNRSRFLPHIIEG